jgi:hypothetical protein
MPVVNAIRVPRMIVPVQLKKDYPDSVIVSSFAINALISESFALDDRCSSFVCVGSASLEAIWTSSFACATSISSLSRFLSTTPKATATESFGGSSAAFMLARRAWISVLCAERLLQIAGELGSGQFHSVLLVMFGQLKPIMQLLFKVAVANQLHDFVASGLLNLKCRSAVRAYHFVHDG